jgi:hypothetical protein
MVGGEGVMERHRHFFPLFSVSAHFSLWLVVSTSPALKSLSPVLVTVTQSPMRRVGITAAPASWSHSPPCLYK